VIRTITKVTSGRLGVGRLTVNLGAGDSLQAQSRSLVKTFRVLLKRLFFDDHYLNKGRSDLNRAENKQKCFPRRRAVEWSPW
jgi:hypothetical protein